MKTDRPFLEHILAEIDFLERETRGLKFEQLIADELLKRGVARSLEIIGEAVKNLSSDFKAKHKNMVWKKIAGFRDKLIHYYFGVNWDIVWDVIQTKLPELRKIVESELKANNR